MEGTQVNVGGCPQCHELSVRVAELERLVEQLRKQNEELSKKLEQTERSSKRQAVRFPRRQRSQTPKKPGRKGGHQAQRRAVPAEVDRTVDVPVDPHCPECGHVLRITTHTQYQTDIPPVRPRVTQFNVQVGECPCCGKRVQGRHEDQTSDALGAAHHTLGPNAHAMAASLKHGAGMSYAKISRFLLEWLELRTAASTFVRVGQRIARKAQPTMRVLREQLVGSSRIHADETGWRIGTQGAWLWVFANDEITLFDIGRRGHEVAEQMLAGFEGVLCCDGYAAYDPLELVKSRCNGHILNRISGLKELCADDDDRFALEQIDALFREAHDLHRRHRELTAAGFRRRTGEIETRFDDWLWLYEDNAAGEILRLRNHLAAHRQEWFLYLYNPDLPTTNNLGERQIRPGVMTRKTGGCNRTPAGAFTTKTLASLIATCRQQTKSFAAAIRQLLRPRAPTAIDLATLPTLS